jgi:hypothetical protein
MREEEFPKKTGSMSIAKEQLDIFSENDVNVITTDLNNEQGNTLGPKIQIRIPYNN